MSQEKEAIEIVQIEIKKVKPASYNPRDISIEAMAGLKNSIKEFGIVDPFIVNKRNMTLVGGHQRLKAASELGYKKIPVVYVDLTPARERALNVTLNNPKISGHYTKELRDVLAEISKDMPEFNFEALRMDALDSLIITNEWDSSISNERVDKTQENLDGIKGKIKITCPQDIKDEVLIYLKAKFLEVSFEGVHIE